MLPILLSFSLSVNIVIDFGSFLTKTAEFTGKEHPSIATNLDSKRTTPTFFAFRGPKDVNYEYGDKLTQKESSKLQPFIGDRAITLLENRPWMGTGFLPLFVDADKNMINNFTKLFFINEESARVQSNDFLPLFFRSYIKEISGGKNVDSVTVVVPAHYTIPQREIIKESIQTAGYSSVSTIDDVDAVATFFGVSKGPEFKKRQLLSLFVDVGAYKTEAYVVNFTTKRNNVVRAERLSYAWTECGSAHITGLITEYFADSFSMKLTKSEYRRLFGAAEELKKRLTVLKTAEFVVENINGEDRKLRLTRRQLDRLTKNAVKRTQIVIKEAIKGIKIDEINIIGGGSRVIAIGDCIAKFGKLKRQLNGDETVALGAAYAVQQKRRKSAFNFVDIYNEYPVYTVTIQTDRETTEGVIKGRKSSLTKYISKPTKKVTLLYRNSETNNLVTKSFTYLLNKARRGTVLKMSESPYEVSYITTSNLDTIGFERIVAIPKASSVYYNIVNSDTERMRQQEQMGNLEYAAYSAKQSLEQNETFIKHTNSRQRNAISKRCDEILDWCFNNINKASTMEIEEKNQYLNELISDVEERISDTNTIDESLAIFLQAIEICNQTAHNESIPYKKRMNLAKAVEQNMKWYRRVENEEFALYEKRPMNPKSLKTRASNMLRMSDEANGIENNKVILPYDEINDDDTLYEQMNSYL